MAGWDEGRVFATRGASLDSGLTENGVGIVEADYHQLAGFASEMLSTAEVSARFSRFLRGFQDDNIFVYRYASWVFVGLERSARARERRRLVLMVGAHSDQLRNNVTLGQFRVDVDIAHMSAFDGELAAAIQEAPREFLPAVRTRERASERFTRERSNTRRSSSKLLVKNVARWVSLRKSKSMDSLLAVRPMKTRTMSSSTQYLRSKYSSVIVLHDLCQYVRLAYVHSTLSKLLPGGRRSPLFDVAKVYKT